MSKRALIMSIFIMVSLIACGSQQGGRPAPNSAPTPNTPQASAPQLAAPQNQPPAPGATHSATQTQTQTQTNNTNPAQNPGLPRTPPGGKPGTPPVQTQTGPNGNGPVSSVVVQFDNRGGPTSQAMQNQAFLVTNFDSINLPKNRLTNTETVNGTAHALDVKKLAQLSNDSYLACAQPDCLNNISTLDGYNDFAQSCWIKTLTNDVARFQFAFGASGDLSFLGQVNQARYGAKNISYSFDGDRNLTINPFIAAGTVNGQSVAIVVTGIPFDTTASEGIHVLIRSSDPGNSLKSTMSIEEGALKQNTFSTNGTKRYVGSTLAKLSPIDLTQIKTVQTTPSATAPKTTPK